MNAACMGGWCPESTRLKCCHYFTTTGPVVERLCESGQRDAYSPIWIAEASRTVAQPTNFNQPKVPA